MRDALRLSGLDPAGIFLGKAAAVAVELLGARGAAGRRRGRALRRRAGRRRAARARHLPGRDRRGGRRRYLYGALAAACGSARRCSRCCSCPCWRRCSSAPPGPSRRRWPASPPTAGRGAACWPPSPFSTPSPGPSPSAPSWRVRDRPNPADHDRYALRRAGASGAATGQAAPAHTGSPATRVLGVLALGASCCWCCTAWSGARPTPRWATRCGSCTSTCRRPPSCTRAASSPRSPRRCGCGGARRAGTSWPGPAPRSRLVFTAHHPGHRLALGPAHLGHLLDVGRPPHLHRRCSPSCSSATWRCGASTSIPTARSTTGARCSGLLLVPNVMIVNRSVEWWRSLHQTATLLQARPHHRGHDALHPDGRDSWPSASCSPGC